ncbi:MAG: Sua5 family C-terminal domain-containing protein [Planctomycetaceae bacterium]
MHGWVRIDSSWCDGRCGYAVTPGGNSTGSAVEEVVGKVVLPEATAEDDTKPQSSPGMLLKHYAPRKPLYLVDDLSRAGERFAPAETGVLAFGNSEELTRFAAVEQLSEGSDLREAAIHFFSGIRRLDKCDIRQIVATPFPDEGLGRAAE